MRKVVRNALSEIGRKALTPHTHTDQTRPCRFPRRQDAGFSALYLHSVMCKHIHMATNLALDDQLIEEARRAGSHKYKKEAVTAALEEYVRRRQQMRILEAFGTFAA